MSTAIEHVFAQVGELRMHAAVAGPADGPAVLLCHGFPESWYSWRHQLLALGDAGYRVIAPDQRGYGQTDAPTAVEAYSQLHLVGDLVGLLEALGIGPAAVVGHDWGGPVAWHAALLRPDVFTAVAGLSVPFSPRVPGATLPTQGLRAALGDAFFYVLYFQDVGVAEAELDGDIRGMLRRILYSISGDIPPEDFRFFDPKARCFNDLLREPPALPEWLTEADLDVFTSEFERKGTFRHGINWYRNIDRTWELLAPFVNVKVQQPALFIGAERDAIFGLSRESVAATKEWVPNLREPIWVPDCGHWIQQEEPQIVNEALLDFLGSL
ncbi:MAG TPA: alpha/beta hydrolase [Frankiaceae bacterium]|jgi:pimeloyl-ACP methyl ester carboxylesterase|nr:alpha/beta hydrolase [Frankiaceae bacterium]